MYLGVHRLYDYKVSGNTRCGCSKKGNMHREKTITLDGSPCDSSRSVYVRLAQPLLIRSCNTIILSIDNLLIK